MLQVQILSGALGAGSSTGRALGCRPDGSAPLGVQVPSSPLGCRSVVGRLALDQKTGVQILPPQLWRVNRSVGIGPVLKTGEARMG